MRGLPARRIASSALCGALLLGLAGPAAAAAETETARARVQAASRAPVPGADALLAQVQGLGNLGAVLTPVTDLLNAVLKADSGQLSPEEATKLGDAVKDAIAKVSAAAPAAPAVPVAPPAPTLPTSSLPTSTLPALPSLTKSADDSKASAASAASSAMLPADLVADSLAALQKAVDTLLKAVTSGDVTQVVPAVTGVLTGLVNVLAATLLGGKLPLPNLPGLPALPSLPSLPTSSLPTSSLPTSSLPTSSLPTSSLPTSGLLPVS
ncbi:hypothetical protein OHT57_18825 [Streptomyces sp. NBC_00285]|uniref:hypothetical protein n=1 Tax=Streptomyces sp. NBC_00285 TaxID=2975700 RepID=UPI002E27D407|nr:hypothetical protein [Streptomyces sp. NBC_00285]